MALLIASLNRLVKVCPVVGRFREVLWLNVHRKRMRTQPHVRLNRHAKRTAHVHVNTIVTMK